MIRHPFSRVFVLGLALASLSVAGCARCRIPAFDPTGERLFNGTTTLNGVDIKNCPLIPHPAWVQPARPPVCPVAAAAVPAAVAEAAAPAGPCGPYVTLNPLKLVAPVGSDVVLTAGLCGPDGFLVTKQPVEWMISPESVGSIQEVGEPSPPRLVSFNRLGFCKVNTNYALAHTSTAPYHIDRGTPQCDDDVQVKKGQSWISVSSPSEGTSFVSVLAPKGGAWESRKQTASIYWVDASWTFPPPVATRAGDKAVLTSSVMRTNGTPVAGWTVRYEVIDGPGAGFANNTTAVDLVTDANGIAAAELLPTSAASGITRVRVSIIRPASGRGDAPPLVIGQGFTSVAWSAPGLVVSAQGVPDPVPVGGVVRYRVDVANTGDLLTRDVVLNFSPPVNLTIESSNPPGQPFGQRMEWRLGDLDAKRQASVEVTCRTTRPGDLRATFRATGGELTAEGHADTRVISQAIGLRIISPERAVPVGQEVVFDAQITNNSRAALSNVVLTDAFGPGLARTDGGPSPIRQSLQEIQPGETIQARVRFIVRQPGQQCHRIAVEADGGHTAELEACVTGAMAAGKPLNAGQPGKLEVRIVASPQAREGETSDYVVEVSNPGAEPLTNVRVSLAYGENLRPTEASEGWKQGKREVSWQIPRLDPGAPETLRLKALVSGGEEATVRASASADQAPLQTTDATTAVIPAVVEQPERRPMGNVERPLPVQGGKLKVSIAELANPARVGKDVIYSVTVKNEASEADEDVSISVEIPPGLTPKKPSAIKRGPGIAAASPDGRQLDLRGIQTLRSGEQVSFSVEASALQAGTQTLRLRITSRHNPAGLEFDKATTVVQ